jgi:hypothetical protein
MAYCLRRYALLLACCLRPIVYGVTLCCWLIACSLLLIAYYLLCFATHNSNPKITTGISANIT